MTEEEIKPCPFCGSKATYTVGNKQYRITDLVMCTKCDATIEVEDDPGSALKQWNRRFKK
jgi:Lar family restriction alleviation protein